MRAVFSNAERLTATTNGVATVPEKLKHLAAHPAAEPQSFVFFSHGSW
jgi:hypothetical protein